MDPIVVKPNYRSDLRRFTWTSDVSFKRFVDTISSLYMTGTNIVVKYTDDEGDIITISSDEELKEAIRVARFSRPPVLRCVIEDASEITLPPDVLTSSWVVLPPSHQLNNSTTTTTTATTTTTTTTTTDPITVNSSSTANTTNDKSESTSPSSSSSAAARTTPKFSIKGYQLPRWARQSMSSSITEASNTTAATTTTTTSSTVSNATTTTTESPSIIATAAASQPEPLTSMAKPVTVSQAQTINDTVRNASQSMFDDIRSMSREINVIVSDASARQHHDSIANSPPKHECNIDRVCRDTLTASQRDCTEAADSIASHLQLRSSNVADESRDNHWKREIYSSALAEHNEVLGQCKLLSDDLTSSLRLI